MPAQEEIAIKVIVTKAALMELCDGITDVIMRKNHDYKDAWQQQGIFTPLIRIKDKLLRMITLTNGEQALVPEEGIKDTLLDIVAYGLLALLYLQERNRKPIKQLPLFNPEAVLQMIASDGDDEPDGQSD